jgi:hypothetical protein
VICLDHTVVHLLKLVDAFAFVALQHIKQRIRDIIEFNLLVPKATLNVHNGQLTINGQENCITDLIRG